MFYHGETVSSSGEGHLVITKWLVTVALLVVSTTVACSEQPRPPIGMPANAPSTVHASIEPPVRAHSLSSGYVTSIAAPSDKCEFLICDSVGYVRTWSMQEERITNNMNIGAVGKVSAAAVHRDGTQLVAGFESGQLLTGDLSAARVIACKQLHQGSIRAVEFLDDGDVLAVTERGAVMRMDGSSLDLAREWKIEPNCRAAAIDTPNGRVVATCGKGNTNLQILTLATGSIMKVLPRPKAGTIESVAISPDGGYIAASTAKLPAFGPALDRGRPGEVRLWRLSDGQQMWRFIGTSVEAGELGNESLYSPTFVHGGAALVVGSDIALRVLSIADGSEVSSRRLDTDAVPGSIRVLQGSAEQPYLLGAILNEVWAWRVEISERQ